MWLFYKGTKKLSVCVLSALLISAMTVTANAESAPDTLVPGGMAVGISVKVDGVIVSELSEKETESGTVSPARDAGIQPGDIITQINGTGISSVEELINMLKQTEGDITVRIKRGNEEHQLKLVPYRTEDECFIGIWTRDAMNGIGTVTFYDPETGVYGALGHPVSDSDTGVLLPIRDGAIVSVQISGITVGKAGEPGRLGGVLNASDVLGDIDSNTLSGIFGKSDDLVDNCDALKICKKEEIETGAVKILSAVDGTVKEYDAEITRVYSDENDNRTMMLKITDEELIEITGGIVQGMSGSPILQNGRLVGAVTHVLINDPTKGYGISIEKMLSAAGYETENAA